MVNKKLLKEITAIILFAILLMIGGSLIQDLLALTVKDYLNQISVYIISVILTYIMIVLLLKTKPGKEVEKIIFKKIARKFKGKIDQKMMQKMAKKFRGKVRI